MYRKIDDFINEWDRASAGTLNVLEALTDEKLNQAIVEGHNTLGWLGWHLTNSLGYFAGLVGLKIDVPGDFQELRESAAKIAESYEKVSADFAAKAKETFTDLSLLENVDHHGTPAPRGEILRTMIDHQTHHRGQMTVLLRQAGLKVPGVMGPTKEDLQK